MSTNTLETAQEISLSSSKQTLTDSVSANLADYYRFQLKSYSSLSAVLDRLSGDANLELIQDRDRNGIVSSSEILAVSNNQGAIGELVSAVLKPGTYYLRVSTDQDSAHYSLNLSAVFDLKTDLTWRNYATGENAVWQVSNNAIESAVYLTQIPDLNWKIEGIADFNHDGQVDLVWRNYATGENGVWLMNNNAIQSAVYLTQVPDPNWKIEGVADFNHDGQVDLVWRNYATGENGVWLMNNNVIQSTVWLLKIPDLNWKIEGVADFNHDEQVDLVWRNYATGENAVWLMNNNAIGSSVYLTQIPDLNWKIEGVAKQFEQRLINDAVGNTIATAFNIGTLDKNATFRESLGGANDLEDVYQFTLSANSSLSLTLNNLSANVDLQLLNSSGVVIQTSAIAGNSAESISSGLLAAGTYYVRLCLNGSGITSYTLNLSAALPICGNSVQINVLPQPDLRGTFFDADKAFVAGGSLTANFQVQNIGTATAEAFRVGFYLSSDSTITTSDRAIGFYNLNALAKGTTTDVLSATLTLPGVNDAFWKGNRSYYIGMVVDALNVIQESSEGNNANQGIGIDFNEVFITSVITNPVVNYGVASGNLSIDALLDTNHAYWNTSVNGRVITYSFYNNASGYTGREVVSEVSTPIKNNVRAILAAIESFINVRFVEVADTATSCGVVRYMYSDGRSNPSNAAYSFYAYGYYPDSNTGGDVHLNPNRAASFEGSAGTYGYMALLHETLHTLGLKHPGNYNVGGGTTESPFLSPAEDNTTNTVMTYNNGTSDTQYHGSKAITPMTYDIRALQYLYGARSRNANATTYTFNTVSSYSVAGQFFGSTTTELKQAIWDSGGVDTLDFSGLSSGSSYRFDLNSGGILTTQSSYNGSTYYDYSQDSKPTDGIPQGSQYLTSGFGTTIAYGTTIENLINSRGNDYIIANAASNVFKGYTFGTFTGDDVIDASSAADSLELAGFNLSNLTTAVSGSSLTIGLGSYGSIRLQNYYGASGSMKVLVGGTYYTYSGSWQVAAPAARSAPSASLDVAASASGLTATVASTPKMQLPTPAACTCPICSGTTTSLLGTSSLVSAIGLGQSV